LRAALAADPDAAAEEEPEPEETTTSKQDVDTAQRQKNRLEWVVNKHLTWLKDPVDIAAHVRKALDKDSVDEALLMARKASRNTKVEVSWNHLIDYHMKKKRLHAAVKLYQEVRPCLLLPRSFVFFLLIPVQMKKRQQVPNARTFTIIFRGCAESIHPKLAVSEAVKIYNQMISHGNLKPNTIHLNAVLEVCARANDLDSMLAIFATADEAIRSPDSHTYTIVLNGIRYAALSAHKDTGLIDAEVRRVIDEHIDRARAIWANAIARWRSGKILIDEHLVCAMGRILLLGDYHSSNSILDLLEQTMKIPRFDKTGGQLPAGKADKAEPGRQTGVASDATASQLAPKTEAPDTRQLSPVKRKELAASSPHGLFAKPGPNSLSLLLSALSQTKKTSHAPKYWDYFTQVLGVQPDKDNYGRYLKALTIGHASAQMAKLMSEFPSELLGPVHFRQAFGACIADALNPNSFHNACQIFDAMMAKLRYPDPLCMRLFLHSARDGRAKLLKQAQAKAKKQNNPGSLSPSTEEAERVTDPKTEIEQAQGRHLLAAVDRAWEPFRRLTSSFSYPEEATRSPEEALALQRAEMQEGMATARHMISAVVWVLDHGVLDPVKDRETIKILKSRQTVLIRLIQRYKAKLYPDDQPQQHQQRQKGKRNAERRTVPEDPGDWWKVYA
jgi:pentatricopeptide repeat protein